MKLRNRNMKVYRAYRDVFSEFDLRVVEEGTSGKGHYKFLLESSDGKRATITCSRSPSDWRAMQNIRKDCCRVISGVY